MNVQKEKKAVIYLNKIKFHNVTRSSTINIIKSQIDNEKFCQIVTPNIDHLALAENDIEFKNILNNAELSIPDGMGVIYLSRILNSPLIENVGGRLLFMEICNLSVKYNWKLFFLGSKDNIALDAAEILRKNIPGIQIVGAISPSSIFERDKNETKMLIDEINKVKPDILFVGVGAPKSEKWIYNNKNDLKVKIAMVMGHGFDLIVGKVNTAPKFMTDFGFEWLYRMVQNPRYLFKRYILRDIPFFIKTIIKEKIFKK